jgi:hypothetical protein
MSIKGGSGKGSTDAGGTKGDDAPGVGGSNRRSKKPMGLPPPPPKKPLQPDTTSPFPEKKEFRLGQFRVVEERDDYLICTGFDPNAKNPFSEVTPSAFRSGELMKVAKPWELQRTLWDGATVTIGDTEYTYDYSDTEIGVRTAESDGGEEEQRIDLPYLLEGRETYITAVQIRKNAAVDGTNIEDEEGTRLRWMDLNVAGRHWKGPGGGSDCPDNFRIIVVGNPTTGTFDLTLVLPDGSDTLTLNWDDTAAEVEAAIEAHAHWIPADYTVVAADGDFPTNSISIQFSGTGALNAPTVSNITLSGGARSGVRVERACCEEAV